MNHVYIVTDNNNQICSSGLYLIENKKRSCRRSTTTYPFEQKQNSCFFIADKLNEYIQELNAPEGLLLYISFAGRYKISKINS
jgi:hypothetical protein